MTIMFQALFLVPKGAEVVVNTTKSLPVHTVLTF